MKRSFRVALLLPKHAPDEVIADHRIDAVMEFDGGRFPAAELAAVEPPWAVVELDRTSHPLASVKSVHEHRLGQPASGEGIREAIKDRGAEAVETFERFREHLTANGVDWTKTEATLGPWLEIDAEKSSSSATATSSPKPTTS